MSSDRYVMCCVCYFICKGTAENGNKDTQFVESDKWLKRKKKGPREGDTKGAKNGPKKRADRGGGGKNR